MKAIRILLFAIVIIILQVEVAPAFSRLGAVPDLLTVLLVALVLERGPVAAVIIGFVLGFLQDLGDSPGLGTYALAKSLVAYAVSRFGAGFLPESVLFKGAIVFAASLAHEAVVLVAVNKFDLSTIFFSFFRHSVLSALYTAVVGLIIFAAVETVTGRMVGARARR